MGNNRLVRLMQLAIEKWGRDDCGNLGAALAYFALFSLFPLLLVILSLVGFFVDPNEFAVQQRLLDAVGSEQVRELITQTLQSLNQNSTSTGLIGFATLLLAASGIFGVLDKNFDVIWEVRQPENQKTGIVAMVLTVIKDKLVSFALVLGCVLLMLLSVMSTVLVTAVSTFTDWLPGQGFVLQTLQFLVSLALLALAFGSLFKVLPSRRIKVRDVIVPALIAALLFTVLQKVVGIYLSRANYASYGAIGGVMALMVWIYLSSLVLLFGGELSYAWAHVFGSMRNKHAPAASDKKPELEQSPL